MNLAQTLDVAAQFVARADLLIHGSERVQDEALHRYWMFSRDLASQWMQNLAICQKVIDQGLPIRSRQCWLEYEPDIREILRADVLHRVWYAVLQAADQEQGICHSEPIARSVLSCQMQARIRALKLIMAGHQFDAARMRSLNELRRNTEAWTDFLCAHLAKKYQLSDVLFHADRSREWEQRPLTSVFPELQIPGSATALTLLNWSITATSEAPVPQNALQRLGRKMLECFPASAFDQNGLLRSVHYDQH